MIKDALRISLAILFGTTIFGVPPATHAQNRPNIILLMGDDHGWEETGYNGHPYVHTPILDDMAASGLRFDRFYAAHPSCSPTRGSVLTGRHPNRYGTFAPNWSIRPDEITIADLLQEAGYATGHFGKWHVGPVKSDSPTNPGAMGFDEWLSHDNFFELNPILSLLMQRLISLQTPKRPNNHSLSSSGSVHHTNRIADWKKTLRCTTTCQISTRKKLSR